MQWQLRMYRLHPGGEDSFAEEWRVRIRPLREAMGFEVLGPWVGEEGLFVWLIGHERLEEADAAYYASPERAAFDPDPARHIADVRTWLLEER
jgi:hypothetical protein